MDRNPTALFAPVMTRTPPGNSFERMVLPLSRDRGLCTRPRSTGLSSMSGSMRCFELRFAISTVGWIDMTGPGA
jgi:hypothetical protein